MTGVVCVWPAAALLGEAPLWCPGERALYWVDIDGRAVLRFDERTGDGEIFPQPFEVGCVVRRDGGGFVAGTDAGLAFLDDGLTSAEVFASPERDRPGNRFNDGKCDRRGRFWVGSTDRDETRPSGALYRVQASHEVERMVDGVIVSNGLGWSLDDRTFYFTDSGRGVIYAYDYTPETGDIANRRVFAAVDPRDGTPDGLTVDAEGHVWSAHWNGWRVTRYAPDGTIDRIVEMPVPLVTSVAFGGEDLRRLYITTARLGLTGAELDGAPLSGGLFAVDAGIAGLPDNRFAG